MDDTETETYQYLMQKIFSVLLLKSNPIISILKFII